MPAVPPKRLIEAILAAISESGGNGYLLSNIQSNPRKFLIEKKEKIYTLELYIWTLTPGGRPTLPNEYRIQMTSVQSPLSSSNNDDIKTVLMGYYLDLDIFAGFDIETHKKFTVGSPSVQIDKNILLNALQNGLAFGTKNNSEIVIGVRPDNFLFYVENSILLHQHGKNQNINFVNELNQESNSSTIHIEQISPITERQKIISTVSKTSRDSRFKLAVLSAYDRRCAITRNQLNLLDAAHILPVAALGSQDIVSNGIALSPTMHRAYDNRLIYIDTDYKIRLNEFMYNKLKDNNLIGGYEYILEPFLDQTIHLPQDENQRPNKDFIKQANQYRLIKSS